MRARGHLGRIGAEERGRDGDGAAGNQREVEREEMMPLETPAPRGGRLRDAEDADVILLGIAQEAAEGLQLAQDLLELHHVDGLRVAHARERGLHQLVGGRAGGGGHLLERDTGAAARYVVPVPALVVAEREYRGLAL